MTEEERLDALEREQQELERCARAAALRLLQRREWDAQHLATLGTKVTPEEAAEFKSACESAGTTPYAALQRIVRALLRKAT